MIDAARAQFVDRVRSDQFVTIAQLGYYTDNETGLELVGFRYYDPATGRFMTVDPINYLGGVNLYSYVANNPVNFIDPIGLDKLILPGNPSGLPQGWKPDSTHRYPGGERWKGPDGDTLDFHKGQPGRPGWRGRDHWHHNDGKKHYRPGDGSILSRHVTLQALTQSE